jgi:hypothetical protein
MRLLSAVFVGCLCGSVQRFTLLPRLRRLARRKRKGNA